MRSKTCLDRSFIDPNVYEVRHQRFATAGRLRLSPSSFGNPPRSLSPIQEICPTVVAVMVDTRAEAELVLFTISQL